VSISIDFNRIKSSLESGEPVRIPQGLSREEMREFIIKTSRDILRESSCVASSGDEG